MTAKQARTSSEPGFLVRQSQLPEDGRLEHVICWPGSLHFLKFSAVARFRREQGARNRAERGSSQTQAHKEIFKNVIRIYKAGIKN